MNRLVSIIFGFVFLGFLTSSCLFIVDQRQFALVFALGEIKRVVKEPGLYFKLPPPFQNIVYLEKSIRSEIVNYEKV